VYVSIPALHDQLRAAIPIHNGDADIWALFRDVPLYLTVLDALSEPFRGNIDAVLGAESRGFVLGQALALHLGLPFVGIRKDTGFFPGKVHSIKGQPDYRGAQHTFRLQEQALRPGDRVILADDWIETGSQAMAIKALVEQAGAVWSGVACVVDQTSDERRAELGLRGVITNTELYAGRPQHDFKADTDLTP
jgi:adenine phosphoribosyltransferase